VGSVTLHREVPLVWEKEEFSDRSLPYPAFIDPKYLVQYKKGIGGLSPGHIQVQAFRFLTGLNVILIKNHLENQKIFRLNLRAERALTYGGIEPSLDEGAWGSALMTSVLCFGASYHRFRSFEKLLESEKQLGFSSHSSRLMPTPNRAAHMTRTILSEDFWVKSCLEEGFKTPEQRSVSRLSALVFMGVLRYEVEGELALQRAGLEVSGWDKLGINEILEYRSSTNLLPSLWSISKSNNQFIKKIVSILLTPPHR
jgi:hypothetical protein